MLSTLIDFKMYSCDGKAEFSASHYSSLQLNMIIQKYTSEIENSCAIYIYIYKKNLTDPKLLNSSATFTPNQEHNYDESVWLQWIPP